MEEQQALVIEQEGKVREEDSAVSILGDHVGCGYAMNQEMWAGPDSRWDGGKWTEQKGRDRAPTPWPLTESLHAGTGMADWLL